VEESDLESLWLHGRGDNTVRTYRRQWREFRAFVAKPLGEITLGDLQRYASHLESRGLSDSSRHGALAAIKSCFAFAARQGFVPHDVSTALRMPVGKDTLNERILSVDEVRRLIEAAGDGRDGLIVQLLYYCAPRVSELCSIEWKDISPRKEGGQVTIFGKGRKTRTVLIPPHLFEKLIAFGGSAPVGKIFGIGADRVRQIVAAIAVKAGLGKHVTPHFLRHCNATHSIENGCDLVVVQNQLGHASLQTTTRYTHRNPNRSTGQHLEVFQRQ